MKINGLNHSNNIHAYKKNQENVQSAQGKKQRDQLEISSEAKQLQKKSQFADGRQEKINSIKAKIDAGEYNVDAFNTAKKFYNFWRGR